MNPKQVITESPLVGGQAYAANMKGGVLLTTGQQIYQNLFALSVSSPEAYAKVLTNLDNAGRMNDAEGFVGVQYGVRLVKLTDGAATAAQVSAAIKFLSSCRLQLLIGPNKQRVLDVETVHFLNTANFIAEEQAAAVGVAMASAVPINNAAWMALPGGMEQQFKQNMNFAATLECELPEGTPAELGYTTGTSPVPQFAFVFLVAGKRIVFG